ncbi:hypothetical protein KCU85_g4286, partial [Aureobasidium melanogenum]
MDITLLIPLQQMAYLPFCATIITLTVVERRNPILTEPSADTVLLLLAIAESLFMITSIAFRISLAIFFRRFLVDRTQRKLVLGITGLYCGVAAFAFFLCLFPCGAPVHVAAKRINGKCIPNNWWNGLLYFHGALSALADWFFALLPMVVLWKSSMPAKNKLGVSLLMLLAVCGSICAVLRTIYVGSLEFYAAYYDPQHPTYYHTTALIVNMAVLELGLGITAASAACLMPLFRRGAALCRRHLGGRLRPEHLSGKQQRCTSIPPYDVSLDPWKKLPATSENVTTQDWETIDMEMLGVLPPIELTSTEDKNRDV